MPYKNALVTGGAGFLGSYVVELLQAENYNVFAPRSKEYDLTEESNVKRLYNDVRPDVVIHLAAVVGGIGFNRENPVRLFEDNMLMGTYMLRHAHRNNVPKYVTVGTVCSYPKHCPVPFSEDALWDGYPEETNSAYGIAKKALLTQAMAYEQQYGYKSTYLIPVNLYGPRDNFNPDSSHVIPALIKKFVEAQQKGEPQVCVWGTGNPTREFIHVEDAARGILHAVLYDVPLGPYNLGSGFEISIRDLANMIAGLTGYTGEIVWESSKPDGQPRRMLDVSRAIKHLRFRSMIPFESGLHDTIEWYKQWQRSISPQMST